MTTELFIKRIPSPILGEGQEGDKQTLGELQVVEQHEPADLVIFNCKTLERPWLLNQRKISCIPADRYLCRKVAATKNIPYPHIAIVNVPDRDGICIHAANFVFQLLGCISVGKDFIDIDGDGLKDVTSSRPTLKALMALLPDEFYLTIS